MDGLRLNIFDLIKDVVYNVFVWLQPKWNDALLEMFRIDYVGTSPYISCLPFMYHHRLGPKDQFLILSSDGLYQYFTNEEVVAEVELFISLYPEGDPAQHLVEEVLLRAAKKAGKFSNYCSPKCFARLKYMLRSTKLTHTGNVHPSCRSRFLWVARNTSRRSTQVPWRRLNHHHFFWRQDMEIMCIRFYKWYKM